MTYHASQEPLPNPFVYYQTAVHGHALCLTFSIQRLALRFPKHHIMRRLMS